MSKIRIYELAKQLGVANKDLVAKINSIGIEAKSHMAMLTEEEAAAYIGVSPATLRSWRCRERGPRFIKVGRRVGYLRKDLDAYLSAHVSCPVASLSE